MKGALGGIRNREKERKTRTRGVERNGTETTTDNIEEQYRPNTYPHFYPHACYSVVVSDHNIHSIPTYLFSHQLRVDPAQ